ncbi:MAG: dimethylsulfoxide reductase subunit B [Eggerthellaceae bacterium]|nr:dimethylsulfoxide reductase subunit B [Eggerthellaceae bacterium]
MPLGFFFNNERCTGCRTCEMACIDYKDLVVGRRYRRVIDYEGGRTNQGENGISTTCYAYHVSISCNHCDDPACMHVCPTRAMHRDELGLVSVDVERCIGCAYCTMACPYHAPSIDPALKRSSKCDGCTERVAAGQNPMCVDACPLRALEFGDIDELRAAHAGCGSDILPLPDSSYTHPNLVVKLSPAAIHAYEDSGFISNVAEIANAEG